MKIKSGILSLLLLSGGLLLSQRTHAQDVAVKTNLLYGGVALAPNLGLEIGLGQRTTLDLWGAYNPWNLNGNRNNNKKLVHWIAQPEFRYWTCQRFAGHFFGVHGLFAMYNISGHNIPILFGSRSDLYRFEGNMIGGGLSYGYHWVMSNRFSTEFTVGAGYAHMTYDKFECARCGTKLGHFKDDYFGPTKAGITLIFMIK